MTRYAAIPMFALALGLAACGGGSTASPTPGAAASTPPAAVASTPPAVGTPQPTQAPQGSGTIVAILTGGADAGTYTSNENPNCSYGFLGAGVWGANYAAQGTTGMTGVIIVAQPDSSGEGWALQASVILNVDTTYQVTSALAGATFVVTDNGATAVLHATGPSLTVGTQVDLTVNCPSVIRG